MTSALVGLGALALYLAFPSHRHNFDGVACAIAVELGDFRHLLHGNHLLYGPLGWAFHRALGLMGLKLSALWALQVLDSLLGAAGAGLAHSGLRRAGVAPRPAAFCAAALTVSYGWWLWSVEAQVYALGACLLAGALREMLRPGGPRPYALALWHGLAMLSHGANALLAPAALWALGGRREAAGRYLACAGALVLAGYAWAAHVVAPGSLGGIKLWLLGSAALGPGRGALWHGGDYLQWLSQSALAVSPAALLALPVWGAALRELWMDRRRRALCGLWLGAYALLFLHWEPYTLVYRVSDLLPLWLAAAPAAERLWRSARGKAALALYAAALAFFNARAVVGGSGPGSNEALQRALAAGRAAPESAWVAAYGVDEVYVPYFARRRPLNLRYFPDASSLRARVLDVLSRGEDVYFGPQAWEARGAELGLPARRQEAFYVMNGNPKGRM